MFLDSSSKANSSDEDVFSDLLEDDGIELILSTEPVYQLQSCDLVYEFKMAVSSLCVACGHVAVTSKVESGLTVQIYVEKDFGRLGDATVRPIRVLKLDLAIQLYNNNSYQILNKFLISDEIISIPTQSSDCVSVPVGLYKALVGQDVCLLSSPVIVVTPPGGSVYFASIKTLDTSQPVRSVLTNPTPNSRLKLLCETTSNIILLGVMKIKISEKRTSLFSEMLTVCCQNGLVQMIGIPQDETSNTAGVLETWSVSVDSPIQCAYCFKDKLYHSTGRYICETTVSFTVQSAKEEKFVLNTETRRFQLPGVKDIAAYIPGGLIETDGMCDCC